MKTRVSFITNSSSSSYVVPIEQNHWFRGKETLTEEMMIEYLDTIKKNMYGDNADMFKRCAWDVFESNEEIEISTIQDNSIPCDIGALLETEFSAQRYYGG